MFLPWYEKSVVVPGSPEFAHETISAFGAVSFVEAAIFLVSAGVLVLVLTRAEGGRYHLPGGDGTVVFAAGLWASALIFYRVFDRPSINGEGVGASVGIQWGFFVAFVAAGALAFAGQRMRAAARPAAPVRASRPDRYRPPQPASDFDDVDGEDAVVERRGALRSCRSPSGARRSSRARSGAPRSRRSRPTARAIAASRAPTPRS